MIKRSSGITKTIPNSMADHQKNSPPFPYHTGKTVQKLKIYFTSEFIRYMIKIIIFFFLKKKKRAYHTLEKCLEYGFKEHSIGKMNNFASRNMSSVNQIL